MATLTSRVLGVCDSGQHVSLELTIAGVTRTISIDRDRLTLNDPGDFLDAAILRLRSAVKESGASTWAQARAVIDSFSGKI
jgi:hypothetical protein